MPISVPGASSRRGFTLIELLVVLLIMGLFAGLVATIAQPDERARLRVEAQRLAQLLDLAAAESRLSGSPIAWTAEASQYRFWRWRDEGGWSEAREDSLRPRSLPEGMAISALRIEAAQAPGAMRLEFSPYGSLAYDFHMSLGAARATVAATPLGEVRVHASP